jgi:hypothetical protein
MQKHKKSYGLWFTVLLVMFVAGCGGGSSSGSPQGTSLQGTLSVALTDASASGFDHVYVTVSKVRVHQSASATEDDGDWSDITLNPARKIDLLSLTNGVLEHLGQTSLPAGHYTQLRLVLSANTGTIPANSVVLSDDPTKTEIPLKTPSAVQSGIKLINEFNVAPGQRVDLVLDFDALKSIVKRGNSKSNKNKDELYLLKPVIRMLPIVLTGIDGFVDKALLNKNVMISSQQSGTVVRATVPDALTGEFFLSHLAAGNYDVVITADDHATAVIAGVPVSLATSTALVTMVSTSSNPITLPTSTMHTISGTLSTNPTVSTTTIAYVATKQTFTGGGSTVTIKSQAADLTGSYALTLPSAAPVLGQYGLGTLPILFTAPSESGGLYDVEVSSEGYQTETASVDISIANVIKDFTLTPMP